MDCPYLETGGKNRVCKAASSLPKHDASSMEELDEYCMTEEHYRCPSLLGHVLRGGCASGRSFFRGSLKKGSN